MTTDGHGGRTDTKKDSGRIPELDGVRGLAMLLVLVWHYLVGTVQTKTGSLPAYGMKLLSFTWAGVDLFFVLSGFLIGGILIKNRTAPNYYSAFYIRRFCRILPLYFLSLAVFVAATWCSSDSLQTQLKWLLEDPLPIWSYGLFLQNFIMASDGTMGPHWLGITWSLAVEEQFYLVLPVFIRLVPLAALPWALGLLIVSAPVFRTVFYFIHPNAGLPGFLLLPGRWDALFLGVLGAYWMQHPTMRERLHRSLAAIVVCMISGILLFAALFLKNQGISSFGMSAGGHTVIAIISLCVILLGTLVPHGLTKSFLCRPALVWLGSISYGIYIFHQPVLGLLHGAINNRSPSIANFADLGITAVAVVVTLIISVISWRIFEKPIVKFGQRVRYQG